MLWSLGCVSKYNRLHIDMFCELYVFSIKLF